jgi:hypothetical protein
MAARSRNGIGDLEVRPPEKRRGGNCTRTAAGLIAIARVTAKRGFAPRQQSIIIIIIIAAARGAPARRGQPRRRRAQLVREATRCRFVHGNNDLVMVHDCDSLVIVVVTQPSATLDGSVFGG